MLRWRSEAFNAGIIIVLVSTLFHASSEDTTNHPVIFVAYTHTDPRIAGAPIGGFAGVMSILVAGFVALHLFLTPSESGRASALAWLGFASAIITTSTFTILQTVDGIALKRARDSRYALS